MTLGTTISSSVDNNQLSALAACRQESIDARRPFRVEGNKNRDWCDHCQRPYYTKETCWKLHGKPMDWKPRNRRESRALQANSNELKPEIKPSSLKSANQVPPLPWNNLRRFRLY